LGKALEVYGFVYVGHVIIVFTAARIFEPQSSAIRRLHVALKFNEETAPPSERAFPFATIAQQAITSEGADVDPTTSFNDWPSR
jgi:hypothetical protein